MSGDTTALMSDICITSSSAATRGIKFLPKVVAVRQQMRIMLGELDDERRHILGEPVLVGGIVGEQHLSCSGDLGGGLGHGAAILAGHQNVDLTGRRFRLRRQPH